MLRRAVDLNERAFGPQHPQGGILLELLGDAAARLNHMDQARDYMERARRIMAARFGENSPTVGAVLSSWAVMEQRAGQPAEAAIEYEKALAIFRPAGADFDKLRMSIMERYAEVLKATHRKREARALLSEVRNFQGQ